MADRDHPLIFFVHDLPTEMLLFQGRIVDPTKDAWSVDDYKK